MSQPNVSRRGSIQIWPRKRAKHSLARIRSWPNLNQTKPLAFIGYKAGMTHVLAIDNRPKSLTKDQEVGLPATIIDCPPMLVAGVSFYKYAKKISQVFAKNPDKNLTRKIQLPKKEKGMMKGIDDFDDLRLLVQTQPGLTTTGTKKPKLLEIALGGGKDEKLRYAQEKLGQEIKIEEVFEAGNSVDAHGITKGKGFQGTVKRYGIPIRSHKAEKTKRGIGTLGPWQPKRVLFSVAQPGKMGYHLRTEYNKQILKVSNKAEEVNPKSGIKHYGLVKSNYMLIKGSVPGPKKRALVLVLSVRPNRKMMKEAPEVRYIAK